MASIADHTRGNARELFPEAEFARDTDAAAPVTLKCRPPPSRRVPQTTMPYTLCLRLAAAWIGALTLLLAVVLAIRWHG